jgi:hypothetical protein
LAEGGILAARNGADDFEGHEHSNVFRLVRSSFRRAGNLGFMAAMNGRRCITGRLNLQLARKS